MFGQYMESRYLCIVKMKRQAPLEILTQKTPCKGAR